MYFNFFLILIYILIYFLPKTINWKPAFSNRYLLIINHCFQAAAAYSLNFLFNLINSKKYSHLIFYWCFRYLNRLY